ncbi:MAG: sulfatase-like hydrolase/transferase [Niastella sp.]|nr:sulfatase-like hydrolase/transferase [Niastella sp.]
MLPLFYLLNLTNEYYPFLGIKDLITSISLWLLAIPLLLFIIIRLAFPQHTKYALLLLYLEATYFLFGTLQDFLKEHIANLAHYRYLIPLLLCVAILIGWSLKRASSPLSRPFLYFNTLFVILVVMELTRSIAITTTDGQSKQWFHNNSDPRINASICDTCAKPDIYFIIFDGYSASRTLQEYWNYNNHDLDSFLRQQDFYYAWHSRSNYNSTPYSIGSILNMDYHAGNQHKKINILEFCKKIESIQTNSVCNILEKNNYKVINLSYFSLPGQQAPFTMTYLTNKQKLLLNQTLWHRTNKDIGWNFRTSTKTASDREAAIAQADLNRAQVLKAYEGLLNTSAQKHQQPVFVYAHFLIPHDPYYYDSTGNKTSVDTWINTGLNAKENYLSQLKYTNTIIKNIITRLKSEGDRPRVIILQSDHGFRSFGDKCLHQWEFNNLNAVYFPDQDYKEMYDSITSINTFPVLFRKYLHAPIPLLKDSTVYILK